MIFKSQTQKFSFYKNGEDGKQGEDGRGVASTKARYYLSTSKDSPKGGSWSYTAPPWEKGKYLWIREEITYTDGEVVYTNPYCDSSWEAVNDVDAQILEWCMENDKTRINGAKIYTGTITADKLKVDSLESITANIGGLKIVDGDLVCHVNCDEPEGFWEDGSISKGYKIKDDGTIELYRFYDAESSLKTTLESGFISLYNNNTSLSFDLWGIYFGYNDGNIDESAYITHDAYNPGVLELRGSNGVHLQSKSKLTRSPDYIKNYTFIDGLVQNSQHKSKYLTVDLEQFKTNPSGSGVHAILVVCKSWVANQDSGSAYIIHGIQNHNYWGCNQLFRGNYGATVSTDGWSIDIEFHDENGGGYAIYPLI